MAKTETGKNETVTAPDQQQGQQLQLRIDDADAPTYYASTARVAGTGEEITLDLSRGLQPGANNQATMKIDARVILSPWAAKRLAMALGQAVTRYEQTYGTLEIDPRKRLQPGAKNG
ncbi:MAG: DUF3467 domain-containing protein [Phycisphaeraceae bacterium]